MKLYYSAGSCSTCCHMILEETGLKYEAVAIDWDEAKDPNIQMVEQKNPLGTLPIFTTDDGQQLDQNVSILTYLADRVPDKKLLPAFGSFERAQAMNWLSFVAADLHKSIGALFGVQSYSSDQGIQNAVRTNLMERAHFYLKYMDDCLKGKDYFLGKTFSVADAYGFVVTGWPQWLDIPLAQYKNIENFRAKVSARPAVQKVLKAEGLT